MHNILFVCHGNICRSPMAEFVLQDLVRRRGLENEFHIESAATSTEETGNAVHPGTRRILGALGISTKGKAARQMTRGDCGDYDLLIGMDSANIRNMLRIAGGDAGGKIRMLLARDVADPWYTGDFETTYRDVIEGCEALLDELGY